MAAMTLEAKYRRELRATRRALRPKVACAACGVLFIPSRTDQRYHSPACKQAAYRARLLRVSVSN
jgi:hypothetical protein